MSAVAAINRAIDSVITTAGIEYHAGSAIPTATPPYVVGSDDLESSNAYFQQVGSETFVNLHIWALHKMAALDLYGQLHALLDDTEITITGFELERGRLRLITSFQDPVTGLYHAIAEYRALTKAVA
jgi:hypothetical protein